MNTHLNNIFIKVLNWYNRLSYYLSEYGRLAISKFFLLNPKSGRSVLPLSAGDDRPEAVPAHTQLSNIPYNICVHVKTHIIWTRRNTQGCEMLAPLPVVESLRTVRVYILPHHRIEIHVHCGQGTRTEPLVRRILVLPLISCINSSIYGSSFWCTIPLSVLLKNVFVCG